MLGIHVAVQADKDASLQRTLAAERDVITSSMSEASRAYQAPPPIVRPATPPTDPAPQHEVDPSQVDLSAPPAFYQEEEVKPAKPVATSTTAVSTGAPSDPDFNVLASALFTQGSNKQSTTIPAQKPAAVNELFGTSIVDEEEEVLRMPSRSVTVSVKKSKPAASASAPRSPADEGAAVSSAPMTSPTQAEKKESLFDRVKGGIKGVVVWI